MNSIQSLIDKAIKDKNDLRELKKQTSWHASSIGSCLRGQYIKRLGIVSEEVDARTLRVFDMGNKIEDWVVDLIKDNGIETQVRIEDKILGVSGYADIVMPDQVMEIKSKQSKAFWYMQKEGKPMRQHAYQLWLYLKVLNIKEGLLVYVSKDDLSIAEFIVRLDDKELEEEVMFQLNLLNNAWSTKDISLLPLPPKGSWQEKYCKVHKYCENLNLLYELQKNNKQSMD